MNKNQVIDNQLLTKLPYTLLVLSTCIPPTLIWQVQDGFRRDRIQMRFLKYTAQQMKFRLIDTIDARLSDYLVAAKDRQYQFWERNPLSTDPWTPAASNQKLDYTHYNPSPGKVAVSCLPRRL